MRLRGIQTAARKRSAETSRLQYPVNGQCAGYCLFARSCGPWRQWHKDLWGDVALPCDIGAGTDQGIREEVWMPGDKRRCTWADAFARWPRKLSRRDSPRRGKSNAAPSIRLHRPDAGGRTAPSPTRRGTPQGGGGGDPADPCPSGGRLRRSGAHRRHMPGHRPARRPFARSGPAGRRQPRARKGVAPSWPGLLSWT